MYVTSRIFEKNENRTAKWTFCVQHLQSSHRHFSFPSFPHSFFFSFRFPLLVCLQGGENTLKRVQPSSKSIKKGIWYIYMYKALSPC